jgi:2'-5' RNA ligase
VLAVSAWFDDAADAAIRELWRRMAEAAVDDSLHAGPYRPHITLGIWENVIAEVASVRVAGVISDLPAFPVRFRAIGIFPPHPIHRDVRQYAAVWLAPTISPALRGIHEKVHAAMPAGGTPVQRSAPGRWNPHCTLAWRLTRQQALTAAGVAMSANVLPLTATVTRVGLIDTPSEIELETFPLPL